MTEAYPGHELVRFGNFFDRLEIAAAVAGELESLLSLVGPGSARSPYALVS